MLYKTKSNNIFMNVHINENSWIYKHSLMKKAGKPAFYIHEKCYTKKCKHVSILACLPWRNHSGNGDAMAEQELRKLKRAELLEMMIEQGRAVAKLRMELKQKDTRIEQLEAELCIREDEKDRLNEKIERQEKQLMEKDEKLKAQDAAADRQVKAMGVIYKKQKKQLDGKDAKIELLGREIRELREKATGITKADTPEQAARKLERALEHAKTASDMYMEILKKDRKDRLRGRDQK